MRFRIETMRAATGIATLLLLSSCGGGGGSIAPAPPPPPPPAEEITVATEPAFPMVSMQSPVAMLQAPGDASRWFVVEQQGLVRVFPNVANVTNADVDIFANISGRVVATGELGLLGMAFHPEFGNGNFEVFLSYTRAGPVSVINRFHGIDNGTMLDTSMDDIVMTILQDASNHNGGHIAFGPDGFLYMRAGATAAAAAIPMTAHRTRQTCLAR